jgi:uncharacterized protein (TIGR03083 family)
MIERPIPIRTVQLFPALDRLLIDLLRSLTPGEWKLPTLAGTWTVKDIAAHLLDGNLRALSFSKDGYVGEKPEGADSYDGLVAYLNRLNHTWTDAFRRVSPRLLTGLLETTGNEYSKYLASLAPFGDAIFSVAWAGQYTSANWFHIAREYTERWHHQQQIRHALGREDALYAPEFYLPYLDTSMQALPYHYRHIAAEKGTLISFSIPGYGKWHLSATGTGWILDSHAVSNPAAEVTLDHTIAWRIFTKGITTDAARPFVQCRGDETLGGHVLHMLAVMA